MDSINSHADVDFLYLSNEINSRFVALTVLELKAKTFLLTKIKQFYKFISWYFLYQFLQEFLTLQLNFYIYEINCMFVCVSRCVWVRLSVSVCV